MNQNDTQTYKTHSSAGYFWAVPKGTARPYILLLVSVQLHYSIQKAAKKKKNLQDFIQKEQHRLDYNHWKKKDLMKNQYLVTRYENSSKAWKLHCHVWLPLLHSWSHQECFPFVQMGAPQSDLTEGPALQAFRTTEERYQWCICRKGHRQTRFSCLSQKVFSWDSMLS